MSADTRDFGEQDQERITFLRAYHRCSFCDTKDFVFPKPQFDAMGRPKIEALAKMRLCLQCRQFRQLAIQAQETGKKLIVTTEEENGTGPEAAAETGSDTAGAEGRSKDDPV